MISLSCGTKMYATAKPSFASTCAMTPVTASCFFFQAEDGIRDGHVTGVQTCALPICFKPFHRRGVGDQVERRGVERFEAQADHEGAGDSHRSAEPSRTLNERAEAKGHQRSEERRVGKECRRRRPT